MIKLDALLNNFFTSVPKLIETNDPVDCWRKLFLFDPCAFLPLTLLLIGDAFR